MTSKRLAIATAVIVATQVALHLSRERGEIVRVDRLEFIGIDIETQTMNLIVGTDGSARTTTIVFSPDTAVSAQQAMARALLRSVERVEEPQAQQSSGVPPR